MRGERKPVIGLVVGGSVLKERRQHYRVSTVMIDLRAKVGADEDCPLQDVSTSSFSVIGRLRHETGTVVDATLSYKDKHYFVSARIQNVETLSSARIRYGLQCIDDKIARGTLARGLQRISMAIQRQQRHHLRETA